jgi:hypothetical protein
MANRAEGFAKPFWDHSSSIGIFVVVVIYQVLFNV